MINTINKIFKFLNVEKIDNLIDISNIKGFYYSASILTPNDKLEYKSNRNELVTFLPYNDYRDNICSRYTLDYAIEKDKLSSEIRHYNYKEFTDRSGKLKSINVIKEEEKTLDYYITIELEFENISYTDIIKGSNKEKAFKTLNEYCGITFLDKISWNDLFSPTDKIMFYFPLLFALASELNTY